MLAQNDKHQLIIVRKWLHIPVLLGVRLQFEGNSHAGAI